MSQYIEFFTAPDDQTAAAIRGMGPRPYFSTVSGNFFDADDAVRTWESLLTSRARTELAASGEPRIVAPWVNDGSAVFALSDRLVDHLVRAEPTRLRQIADAWSTEVLSQGDDLDAETAFGILLGLINLARDATSSGHAARPRRVRPYPHRRAPNQPKGGHPVQGPRAHRPCPGLESVTPPMKPNCPPLPFLVNHWTSLFIGGRSVASSLEAQGATLIKYYTPFTVGP